MKTEGSKHHFDFQKAIFVSIFRFGQLFTALGYNILLFEAALKLQQDMFCVYLSLISMCLPSVVCVCLLVYLCYSTPGVGRNE